VRGKEKPKIQETRRTGHYRARDEQSDMRKNAGGISLPPVCFVREIRRRARAAKRRETRSGEFPAGGGQLITAPVRLLNCNIYCFY
jgi:hypothetical protein